MPTFIQQIEGAISDGSAGLVVPFETPLSAGNSVIACITMLRDNTIFAGPEMNDGGGEVLTLLTSVTAGELTVQVWHVGGIAGSTTEISCVTNDATPIAISASEWTR